MPVVLMPSLGHLDIRHFCLSFSSRCVFQEHFRDSFHRNPDCQYLRASPLVHCITSLPLSLLLAFPFLQYCYPHGPQPSGALPHFLGADQGSSRSPLPYCWMRCPHRICGSLNRCSCLDDPTDLFGFIQTPCCISYDHRQQVLFAQHSKSCRNKIQPSASQVRNLAAPRQLSGACRCFSVDLSVEHLANNITG